MRAAPTVQARTQPNALIDVPSVMQVADPSGDEQPAQITKERPGVDEGLHSLGAGSEAHHLDGGHEHEVDAPEDRDAEDGARDVLVWFLALFTESRRRLETSERQEAEHCAKSNDRDRGAGRDGEDAQGEGVAVRCGVRDELDEDDRTDHENERDRTPLDRQQDSRCPLGRRDCQIPRHEYGNRAEQEARPRGRVMPDANVTEKRCEEDPGCHASDNNVEPVGADERPSRDNARTRSQDGAHEPIYGARMVELLTQADEAIGHKQHADGGQNEREWYRATDS